MRDLEEISEWNIEIFVKQKSHFTTDKSVLIWLSLKQYFRDLFSLH
jgi:hypothetical protein